MFTPELLSEERGEFVLVSNHDLRSDEGLRISIAYNQARGRFGYAHVPPSLHRCVIVYDIRGQSVPESHLEELRLAFEGIHELRIER
jgi:hypothetical protein